MKLSEMPQWCHRARHRIAAWYLRFAKMASSRLPDSSVRLSAALIRHFGYSPVYTGISESSAHSERPTALVMQSNESLWVTEAARTVERVLFVEYLFVVCFGKAFNTVCWTQILILNFWMKFIQWASKVAAKNTHMRGSCYLRFGFFFCWIFYASFSAASSPYDVHIVIGISSFGHSKGFSYHRL